MEKMKVYLLLQSIKKLRYSRVVFEGSKFEEKDTDNDLDVKIMRAQLRGGSSLLKNWNIRGHRIFIQDIKSKQEVRIDYSKIKRPLPDISFPRSNCFLLNEKAKLVFEKHLNYVEYLPIEGDFGTHYLLNIPYCQIPLDLEKSLFFWSYEKSGKDEFIGKSFEKVVTFNFNLEIISKTPLFSIYIIDESNSFFVTDSFKRILEESGLQIEADFVLVWDSENPNLIDERYVIWGASDPKQDWDREIERYYDTRASLAASANQNPIELDSSLKPNRSAIEEIIQIAFNKINAFQLQTLQVNSDPMTVIARITQYVTKLKKLKPEEFNNTAIELGLLWGEQVVRHYRWQWVKVENVTLIVSPDSSVSFNSIQYLHHILRGKFEPFHVSSLFNSLALPNFLENLEMYQ
jgi:hypothetical protein